MNMTARVDGPVQHDSDGMFATIRLQLDGYPSAKQFARPTQQHATLKDLFAQLEQRKIDLDAPLSPGFVSHAVAALEKTEDGKHLAKGFQKFIRVVLDATCHGLLAVAEAVCHLGGEAVTKESEKYEEETECAKTEEGETEGAQHDDL